MLSLVEDENSDRLVEFAYALHPFAELQFRTERDLEEAVHDLVIGEARSLGRAPTADVGILGLRRRADYPGKRNQSLGEDCSRPFSGKRCFGQC